MKRIGLAALLLAGSLLVSCGDAGQEEEHAASAPETASSLREEANSDHAEEADYYDLVFDTQQDEGKLTARYLYLRAVFDEGEDAVTTGDSAVYTAPDGALMLVDCGNVYGGQEVTDQLKAMGVEKIDVLVLSHPHADHVGGFATVAENFPIGQVYLNGHDYDSATYQNVKETIEELEIPCQTLAEGDCFSLGQEVEVRVYGPAPGDTEQVAGGYLDANDASIAMRLTYGASSFWTSGDLYVPGEQALVEKYGTDIASDVVKINHHGKDTSNCKDYVQTMSPKIAVGMFDSVGSRTVAMRYVAQGAEVFYNCADGAIRVSTTGDGTYDVQTQKIREVTVLPEGPALGHVVVS